MRKMLVGIVCFVLAGGAAPRVSGAETRPATGAADAEFQKLADEFLAGYLAWRPGQGVALGLHEFDGRISDFSKASIQLEHVRLQQFARRVLA